VPVEHKGVTQPFEVRKVRVSTAAVTATRTMATGLLPAVLELRAPACPPIPPPSSSSSLSVPLQVGGEGMPLHNFPSQHGDLFVKYIVDLPRVLTDDQKQALEKLLPNQ